MYNTELVNHKFVETYETLTREGVKIDILTEVNKEDQVALENDLRSRRDIVSINWNAWKKTRCGVCGGRLQGTRLHIHV